MKETFEATRRQGLKASGTIFAMGTIPTLVSNADNAHDDVILIADDNRAVVLHYNPTIKNKDPQIVSKGIYKKGTPIYQLGKEKNIRVLP